MFKALLFDFFPHPFYFSLNEEIVFLEMLLLFSCAALQEIDLFLENAHLLQVHLIFYFKAVLQRTELLFVAVELLLSQGADLLFFAHELERIGAV